MKKIIGLIVAVEINAVLDKYKDITKLDDNVYDVWLVEKDNAKIYISKSGAGEIYASACTQYLITKYNVEVIVNFGIVGALTQELSHESVCLIKKIIHYDFDISKVDNVKVGRYLEYDNEYIECNSKLIDIALSVNSNLKLTTCASGDKFVSDMIAKQKLHDDFGADIVEMESAGIIITCDRNKIPCIFFKAIADTLFGGADEYWKQVGEASKMCLNIVDKVLESL